jgi:hypothetical protein
MMKYEKDGWNVAVRFVCNRVLRQRKCAGGAPHDNGTNRRSWAGGNNAPHHSGGACSATSRCPSAQSRYSRAPGRCSGS